MKKKFIFLVLLMVFFSIAIYAGKWKCLKCGIRNQPESETCIACMAPASSSVPFQRDHATATWEDPREPEKGYTDDEEKDPQYLQIRLHTIGTKTRWDDMYEKLQSAGFSCYYDFRQFFPRSYPKKTKHTNYSPSDVAEHLSAKLPMIPIPFGDRKKLIDNVVTSLVPFVPIIFREPNFDYFKAPIGSDPNSISKSRHELVIEQAKQRAKLLRAESEEFHDLTSNIRDDALAKLWHDSTLPY